MVPGGSLGFRWGEAGRGRWNLVLGDAELELSLLARAEGTAEVALPHFDEGGAEGVSARSWFTRPGLPGSRPTSYEDAPVSSPATPNAPRGVRCSPPTGGANHWFHSDTVCRAFLALATMTGRQSVNGGWAHYGGQEKVRASTGLRHLASLGRSARRHGPAGGLV